jgi:uncharacterized protein
MANRFDVFTVSAPKRDANGFLIVDSTPTRSGVFKYRDSTGNEWGELRHEDDVFSKETLDTLNGIPYTTQENHVMLFTPKDAKKKTFGFTLSGAARVDDHARVPIKILDQTEIDAIENKTGLELSAGYRCDVINETGNYKGERYDKRQKNIRYNHVARVTNARGGETCRIRLDSNSAIYGIEADRIDSDKVSEKPNGESIMTIVKRKIPAVKVGDFRLDAEPVEIPAEHEGVIDRLESRQESMVSAIEERDERIDSLTKEATANQAKIDVLDGENKDLKEANKNSIPSDKLDSAVRERAKFLSYAKDYKLDKAEDMANDDILRGIVKASKKVKDEAKLDDMTYTTAVFDMLDHEHEKKRIASKENLDNHSSGSGADGEKSEFDKAKERRNG